MVRSRPKQRRKFHFPWSLVIFGLGVWVWPNAYALPIFALVGIQVGREMSRFDLELGKSIMQEHWTIVFPLTTLLALLILPVYLAT